MYYFQILSTIYKNLKSTYNPEHSPFRVSCLVQASTQQGCKRDLSLRDQDETETFGFWSETRPRPRPSCNSTRPRRDRNIWFLPRDETETETLQGRDRDVFRDLQPSRLCQNNEWRRSNKNYLYKTVPVFSILQYMVSTNPRPILTSDDSNDAESPKHTVCV